MEQLHVFSPYCLYPIGAVDHQHGLDTCRSFRIRFTLLFLAMSVFRGPACAQNSVEEDVDLEQLYQEIDDAIEYSANYVTLKENNISNRRKDFLRASDANEQLVLAEQLFWLYKPYKNDSALHYATCCINLADSLNLPSVAGRFRSLMARQCSNAGMFMESNDILHQVDKSKLDREGLTEYYDAAMHLCGEVAAYTLIPSERDYYYAERDHYRDSLLAVVDPASDNYLHLQMSALCAKQRYQDALEISDQWLSNVSNATHEEAYAAYYRHIVYDKVGNLKMTRYWLGRSALDDIKCGVMDQASLINLAELLNEDGDLERSFRYIRFTWQCNSFFNTRMRASQISSVLNIIEKNYQDASNRNKLLLLISTIGGTLFALLSLVLFACVRRQKRKLSETGKAQIT